MENTEQKAQSLNEQLAEWLKERGAQLTVYVRTPRGELISPENFIPDGWSFAVNLDTHK